MLLGPYLYRSEHACHPHGAMQSGAARSHNQASTPQRYHSSSCRIRRDVWHERSKDSFRHGGDRPACSHARMHWSIQAMHPERPDQLLQLWSRRRSSGVAGMHLGSPGQCSTVKQNRSALPCPSCMRQCGPGSWGLATKGSMQQYSSRGWHVAAAGRKNLKTWHADRAGVGCGPV